MQRFDVAVAGSGPAGSAAALRLCREGFSVALIDRRAFPRNKLCGEYLNCGAVRELRHLSAYQHLRPEALPVHGMRLYAHDENAEFHFQAEAWSMPRVVLDDRLRLLAFAAGATEIRGSVCAVTTDADGVHVAITRAGEDVHIRARYLIGADGMHSTVARLLKMSGKARSSRYAVGGHYACGGLDGWLEMYLTTYGYVAINPLPGKSANAVFVLSRDRLLRNRDRLSGELRRFSYAASSGRRVFSDDMLSGARLGAGPLAYSAASLRCGSVILAGDAAGFVDPFTGQGVYLALAGARAAADALIHALRHSAQATQALATYERELRMLAADRKRLAWIVRIVLKSRLLSRRAAVALRSDPKKYGALVGAVAGQTELSTRELAGAVARAFA